MGATSSGRADGRMWFAGSGYFIGEATNRFIDIPATQKNLRLRWDEFYRFEDSMIVEVRVLIDFITWLEQIWVNFLDAPLGVSHV